MYELMREIESLIEKFMEQKYGDKLAAVGEKLDDLQAAAQQFREELGHVDRTAQELRDELESPF